MSGEAKLRSEEDETSLACVSGIFVEMAAEVKRNNKKGRCMMSEDETNEILVGVSNKRLQFYQDVCSAYYLTLEMLVSGGSGK